MLLARFSTTLFTALAGSMIAVTASVLPAKADVAERCDWRGCSYIHCNHTGDRCYRVDEYGHRGERYRGHRRGDGDCSDDRRGHGHRYRDHDRDRHRDWRDEDRDGRWRDDTRRDDDWRDGDRHRHDPYDGD
jgi:hypothetical protein